MRNLEDKDLVGKTIQSMEKNSVNVVRLTFTDGTKLELWAEQAVWTPNGSIPGIFAEDGE